MSNRPNTRRRAHRREPVQTGPDRTRIVLAVVAAVAVLGAIVLALTLGGSDDEASAAEVSPHVVVDGEPLPALPEGGPDPAVGSPAPVLEGQDLDRETIQIVPGRGRPTVLVFAAHWCPVCQGEIPQIAEPLGDRLDAVDVYLVSTSVDTKRDNYPVSDWLEAEEWPTRVLMDDAEQSAATAYGLTSFPFSVLVDADGEVVARFAGAQDLDGYLAAVDALSDAPPA